MPKLHLILLLLFTPVSAPDYTVRLDVIVGRYDKASCLELPGAVWVTAESKERKIEIQGCVLPKYPIGKPGLPQ